MNKIIIFLLLFSLVACSDTKRSTVYSNSLAQVSIQNDSMYLFVFHDSIKISYNKNIAAFIDDSLSNQTLKTISKKSVEALVELIDDESESTFLTKCGFCNIGQLSVMVLDLSEKIPHNVLIDRVFDEYVENCPVGYLEYLKENRKKIKKRAKLYLKSTKNI
jgi:hypothetical protein